MSVLPSGHSLPGKGKAYLAAFGKHPGWSDFMDDIGMETEFLIAAKRTLYVKGIASQIETGAWAKLEPDKRLSEFNHVFLSRKSEDTLIGRIWSSSDAKGRREYPMVVCADCIGLPLHWTLNELLPKLEDAHLACKAAQTAEDVFAIISEVQDAIGMLAASYSNSPFDVPDTRMEHARFLGSREWGPNQEGLNRILHEAHSKLAAYGIGKPPSLSDTIFLRRGSQGEFSALSQQIRVPQVMETAGEALWQWNEFFLHQVNPATPILFVLCLDRKWIDVTVGEPTNREFFSLKASRAALPLASDVPYELDEESRQYARNFLAIYGGKQPVGNDNRMLVTIRVVAGLLLLLILLTLFACYLHFAPPGDIPEFLQGAAKSLGNPALLPAQKM